MGCRLKENPESLYVAFFEVAAPIDKNSAPQIVSQYPVDFDDIGVTKELPKFCFPCDLSKYNIAGQFFTFVLTGLDNKQRFGFCRHPPGAAKCLCILSYLPWFDIFYKILNQLAELKNQQKDDVVQELITKLHTAEVPNAHQQVKISVGGNDDAEPVEVIITGPDSKALPTMSGDRNISEYYNAVNDSNMMILFVSLLYERRILITSNKLSRLTAVVHSAASLLAPLYWQHIYIPVMPAHLIDYCCAPMPFLVGVHSSFMPQVKKMALDEVVILNADNNSIETPFEDLQTLPPEAVYQLKKNLKNSSLFYEDTLARSFLKVMVYLLGGYREAIRISTGSELKFDPDIFVQCRSNHMQPFLEKLLQLQHFTQFIDSRVELIGSGKPLNDLFEEELKTAKLDDSLSSKNLKEMLKSHLTTVKTDSKKILKDVQKNVQQKMIKAQGSIRPKANPEAMKLKFKQGRDFANKQLIGMKTKLIKGKETEDLDMRRHTSLTISMPLQGSSAPTSPSTSPSGSPIASRVAMDVRRKTPSNSLHWILEEKSRPMTVAGVPSRPMHAPRRQSSEIVPPSLPPKGNRLTEHRERWEEHHPSNMNLMDDLQEALQLIGSGQILVVEDKRNATDDVPVPMPRRRKVQRASPTSGGMGSSMQRPLNAPPPIPAPPIPPRRERHTPHGSNERLIDIGAEDGPAGVDLSQARGAAVQNALGVDCEDHILAFQSVHMNNNALGASYPREDVPRNSSAKTLLADYGLNFGAASPVGPLAPDRTSPSHQLCMPGLRATSSSPNLQSYSMSSGSPPRQTLVQQVLVQQPPASTLPDLLSPTNNTLPRQSGSAVLPATSPPLMTALVKTPASNPFHIQHTPLQPMASSENPFQPASAADTKDPFADLVSFQREGVTSQSWKK